MLVLHLLMQQGMMMETLTSTNSCRLTRQKWCPYKPLGPENLLLGLKQPWKALLKSSFS